MVRSDSIAITADVLVLGGGPAGTWAAYMAARAGCKVVLADKGYCGSSGATAASGTNLWQLHAQPEQREAEIAKFLARGSSLAKREWLQAVQAHTDHGTLELIRLGYPFPKDLNGQPIRQSLQGPEYMRLMRKTIQQAGVRILDHAPATRLLRDADGAGGAEGLLVQSEGAWRVVARSVVVATGGCAFLSGALGTNVLTGDGLLMAAEAGAALSGMEFSNEYGLASGFSSVTKNFFFLWATFTTEDGTVLEKRDKRSIARLLSRQPVYAVLDKADPSIQRAMRATQPIFFLPFDRMSIDPFTQRFPIALRLEGTVRGNGGIHLTGADCATTVPGLYAAGDAATRELVAGATTGGGSINASWAMTSGRIAGQAAASYALGLSPRRQAMHPAAEALEDHDHTLDAAAVERLIADVQAEVIPFERNLFRTVPGLHDSLGRLHALWRTTSRAASASPLARDRLRLREAAAMAATARWMYASALQRKESRGMHVLEDFPTERPELANRLLVSGLDEFAFRYEEQSQHDKKEVSR
ncbi:FAD-dependent oxidoreductase [Paenibacillus aurantiacus]|uniref:FAD-dependent oxidoreductase n=1 Tax=Paenibacillus aurantiacus TaxID=1936118 RepID=A0ABV5KT60_9BACL